MGRSSSVVSVVQLCWWHTTGSRPTSTCKATVSQFFKFHIVNLNCTCVCSCLHCSRLDSSRQCARISPCTNLDWFTCLTCWSVQCSFAFFCHICLPEFS